MKQLGLIGGIGPASTIDYYKGILYGTQARLHTEEYPCLLINSVNMTAMNRFSAVKDWDGLAAFLAPEVHRLEAAGAEVAALCSNTPHLAFSRLQKLVNLPLVSIVAATCDEIVRCGYQKPLVLGTAFTMENGLYNSALAERGLESAVPAEADIATVQRVIFSELEHGVVKPDSKAEMLALANRAAGENGCDAVILGCTELPLCYLPGDLPLPIVNTTEIHIQKLLDVIL